MKYSLVLQHSQEDCGAACLASIAQHYGKTFAVARLREAIGTGQLGTTLLGLRRGGETLGFLTRSAVASHEILTHLSQLPLPAIIHWKGKHWVLLYGQRGQQFVVADPAIGLRYLSQEELWQGWTDGVILLLQPDAERFYAQPSDPIGGLGTLLPRLLPYRGILLEAFVCVCLIGILSLASPFFIQILTDEVLIRGNARLLPGIMIAVIALYTVRSGLGLVSDYLIAHFAQRLELGLILEFGQQILRLPLTYYETRRSGEVTSRLRDIEKINRLLAQVVVSLPSSALIAIISLGLMLIYRWQMALVALLMAAVMLLTTVIFQPTLRQQAQRAMVLETENQGLLVESFKGALTLKSTAASPQLWDELQERFGRLATLMLRVTQISIYNANFSEWIADISSVILLGLGGTFVIQNQLTIGQLLAFTSLNRYLTSFIDESIDLVDDWTKAKVAYSRLQEVITAKPETQGDVQKPWVNLAADAAISCSHLGFHYPGRMDLLTDFSLKLAGGQAIALIGRSGCGKSSLAKLLAGLYPVQTGNIRVGVYSLSDLALDCVRQQIVLVPQDAQFWSRSILENLRLAHPQASFEQIVAACSLTGIDAVIGALPEKYQTVLGEFGCNLSGGQRQRLAIARAIVADPPILILDESTASLDPPSEAALLDRLLDQRQGKTTILISHRPQVIAKADWIVFLEAGELKLEGKLADLKALPGDHLNFLDANL
ncbi:MAG: peptidase domain-containing ABC transporter [Pegethrix bostrychoides GSE-TBD4-15B]|jgi:ATP-binding cassette subfamily C protein|uniref:Peptidase domain-containing ABC transporter n=1 Tax=Pegethrix bostrychoides GSE-TBD4-15B TaxID=2839662 RepID=A0A951P838_9CYAN|nr:peptidase domain-containing ABC transporter [Pegethrix bostrychoides GSE-TBD4-15B]